MFARVLASKIRRARLVVTPGGHGFFLEHADVFNPAVLRFLKSVRSKWPPGNAMPRGVFPEGGA